MNVLSIKDKLTRTVGVCLVLSLGVVIAYSSFTIRQQAIKVAEKKTVNAAQAFADQVLLSVDHFHHTAATLAGSFSGVNSEDTKVILSRNTVVNILKNIIVEHSDLSDVYTVWEPDGFDTNDFVNKGREGSDENGRFIEGYFRTLLTTVFSAAALRHWRCCTPNQGGSAFFQELNFCSKVCLVFFQGYCVWGAWTALFQIV